MDACQGKRWYKEFPPEWSMNKKNLQESCKVTLQVNAYQYQDSCKIPTGFGFTWKSLASFSIQHFLFGVR